MEQATPDPRAAGDPNDIYANPPDPEVLELEPVHPGINDAAYVARRHALFALCRRYRLEALGPPVIEYTGEEQRIWREVSPKLEELHQRHASRIYLQAKRDLGISADGIPQLRTLSGRLEGMSGMHLVPAEGPIAYRIFYTYIAARGFPCTQFIRHGSRPEFTPEPDMIHDCLGHVPPLVNRDYAELLTMIGKAAVRATSGDHVLALKRLSWFSIEFGLIEEAGETRVFGAGILSSIGEIPFSLSPNVDRRPFVTDEVIETDYDWTKMQERLFVIPSFGFLRREVEMLVRRFGIDVG
jgi:phenylalanine-4-hydroxylase